MSRCISLAVMVCYAAEAVAVESAYKLDAGPFFVQTVEKVVLHCKKRDKELTVRVYYPKGDGPFPVIVFSHGFGANTEAFAGVSRHWVGHGYITIHPQHADARTADAKPTLPKFGGLRSLTAGIAERVRDVSTVFDALDELEKNAPDLKGKMDRNRIGVSGHSYGACVAMLIGGATIEAEGKTRSFADPRVKCILPISAAGSGEYGLTKESWKKADLPALYITGTKDLRPGYDASWRREPFDGSPPKDKYLLVIDGANHFSFGGGPALGGGRLLGGADYAPLVKSSSLAFWDAYLKNLEDAKTYLKADGGLSRFVGDKAKLSAK